MVTGSEMVGPTWLCDDCGRPVPADYGQMWPPFWVCFDCAPKRPEAT